jgi:formylglycine-generating enzyme required for sulfatase activity
LQEIPDGDFIRHINQGLANRHWLILVMTPEALGSAFVNREVNTALNEVTAKRLRGVIPFMVAPWQVTEMPMLWRPLQRYDATSDYTTARNQLFQAIGLRNPDENRPIRLETLFSELNRRSLRTYGYEVSRDGGDLYVPPLSHVPPGEFLMGSDPAQDKAAADIEQPQSRVHVGAFSIADYPVTVIEYATFVKAGHTPPPERDNPIKWETSWQKQLKRPFDPVVMVSWHDAVAYAAWLSQRTEQIWRLPTEAEGEKAARWDERAGVSRIFPWKGAYDLVKCNVQSGRNLATKPIGSYLGGKSPCGALDMSGNVWEWTSSLFKPYAYVPTDGREARDVSARRTLRGGSWRSYWHWVRCAARYGRYPTARADTFGFRLVCGAIDV